MKMLIVLLLLSGCAVAQPVPEANLQQIVDTDLQAAIEGAKANNDTVALQCWIALQAALPALNMPLPRVQGIASAIQAKRSTKTRISAGLPPAVVQGCAQLYAEERTAVMRDMMGFLGLIR